jgi:hypothetical protein
LLAAGCVSTIDGPSPTDPLGVTTTTTIPTTTTTVTLEEGLDSYRECLTEREIAIGEIELDARGRPQMAAAMAELDFTDRNVLEALDSCSPELATGALDLGPDPVLREMVQAGLEDLADCIRREGVVDYPDPVAGFSGLGSPFPVNRIPWTDPDLADAVARCSSQLGASSN